MAPNMLDFLIIGYVVSCYFLSSLRGGAKQVFSWVSLFAAFLVAANTYADVAKVFPEKVFPASFAGTAGFAVMFLVVFAAISLLGKFLDGVFKQMHFGGIDHYVSVLVGLLKGVTLGCMTIVVLMITYSAENPLLTGSLGARYFAKPVRAVAKLLGPQDLKNFYRVESELAKIWAGQAKKQ